MLRVQRVRLPNRKSKDQCPPVMRMVNHTGYFWSRRRVSESKFRIRAAVGYLPLPKANVAKTSLMGLRSFDNN